VPLQKPVPLDSTLMRSEVGVDNPEGLIWQAMYQINSKLGYFVSALGQNFRPGLPDLQFATFLPGFALLQKADWTHDLRNANGTFWKLAHRAGTDKIDHSHNYSLLYHRHLDNSNFKRTRGMMLEIGLGCGMTYGAGGSAKIWPHLFPNASVHFIEIDKACTAKWLPRMHEAGVAKVHIGPQADTAVLSEVVNDSLLLGSHSFFSVVDDGSHVPADIEASFLGLFPHLKSGGLYFMEDTMFATWGEGYQRYLQWSPEMKIQSKDDHSSGTPAALAAILAAGVTGLADVPATGRVQLPGDDTEQEQWQASWMKSQAQKSADHSFFGPLSDRANLALSYMLNDPDVVNKGGISYIKDVARSYLFPQTSSSTPFQPWRPVPFFNSPEEWRHKLLTSIGPFVDLVECSPGICVFRRK